MIAWSTRRYAAVHDAEAERGRRLAICVAALALIAGLIDRVAAEPVRPAAAAKSSARAQSFDIIIRAKLAPIMPAGLDIARLYLPASLATATADPAKVTLELPRELRAGRPNIKVIVRGRATWVPVAIAALTDVAVARRLLAAGDIITQDDLAIEHRALADAAAPPATLVGASVVNPIAPGAPIAARDVALPPPLSRGTQVAVDVRRGAVHVRGTGTLELAARPGEPASARLAATKVVVHGRLVAPATLIVGE